MERENIRNLFKRFIDNQCSAEERETVFEYLMEPQNEILMQELVQEILDSSKQTDRLDQKISTEMFAKIGASINIQEKETKMFFLFQSKQLLKVAASVFVVLLAGLLYFINKKSDQITKVTTAYGETKELFLPDGSNAFLNGNSTLTFSNDWSEGERIVRLSGEAFFSVTHTIDNKKFTVKTADHLSIEVLGTEFNVSSRAKATQVVLESGSVRVRAENNPQTILMEPGEMVEIEKSQLNKALKKGIRTELVTAWKEQRLVLENTPFSEIASMLKETYGLEVVLPDRGLMNKRFTGIIPRKDIDILLNALAISFDLDVIKKDNKVEFKTR